MSTNTSTLISGSVRSARGGLAALLAAMLLAAATLVALSAGQPAAGIASDTASDAQVQKALIDVRTGERASRVVSVPTAEFWAEFRAGEREMR